MDILNQLTLDLVYFLGLLGLFAFCVELITQLTKDLPLIRKMPTRLYVLIVSVTLCVMAVFIFAAWLGITVLWYYVVLAVFASFIVAYISIFGWEVFNELYERYKVKS